MIDPCPSAGPAIANLPHSSMFRIAANQGCEICLVERRTDTWAELDNEIAGVAAKGFSHALDGHADDAEFAPFSPGVEQGDDPAHRIDQIDRAAIRDIDPEAHREVRRDDSIDRPNRRHRMGIDDRDFPAMNLLAENEVPVPHPEVGSDFVMTLPEAL